MLAGVVFHTDNILLIYFLKKYVNNKKTKDHSTTLEDQQNDETSHWP